MSTTTAPLTAEEFWSLPDIEEHRAELIDGEVVEMPSGGPVHETVKSNLNAILMAWLLHQRTGKLFVESAYRLEDRIVLVPDLSMLGSERLNRRIDERLCGAPDLAIEVVSSEAASRLRTKIRLYLKHGSEAVWVVYPEERIVEVHKAIDRVTVFEQDQTLEDPDMLPDFSTLIAAIFEGL